MEISTDHLEEFKQIHLKKTGVELTDVEAREKAGKLLYMMELLIYNNKN